MGQCAGSDHTINICNKELDPTLQEFNLFDQLQGSPGTGGVWTSNNRANQHTLDSENNTVNLWAINRFGEHSFTYTNEDCNESAIITINLGGYPGEDNVDGGANACSSDSGVNLFRFLDNELLNLNADLNGTWSGIGNAENHLTDNSFNAETAGPGTYSFIYTVDAVETCLERTASVVLEVHRAPNSGIGEDLTICDSEDFSDYINFDLFSLITGQDANGIWVEINGTSQISDSNDSIINIMEIFNNNGNGSYSFAYVVNPTHGVCDESATTVTISIPRLFGYFSVGDFCGENLSQISIFYDNPSRISFEHDLTYEIRNTITNELIYTDTVINIQPIIPDDDDINLDPTISSYVLETDITITTPGTYTITTTSIDNVDGLICSSLSILDDTFTVYDPEPSIVQTCFEKDDIATVTIGNYTNANGVLINETKLVSYTVTHNGLSETISNYSITFINGTATIPVDLALFPDSIEGDFNIIFNNLNNEGLGCINYTFPVLFYPDDITLDLQVDNQCDATNMVVIIDAPTLLDGTYQITYEVTEIGNPELLINNEINIVGGQANYQVDISNLEEGNYTVVLKSIQNDTHPCRTVFEFELMESFAVGGIPDAPLLDAEQTFCFSDFSPNGPTLQDIVIGSGENLTWYDTIDATDSLDSNTLLVNGEDYFVTAANGNNSCESLQKSVVTVTIIEAGTVTTGDDNPVFCSSQNATLEDLDVTAINNGTFVWYNSNDEVLNETTLLSNETYFVVESINGCESATKLQFNVTVITPTIPVFTGETVLCALDELTLLDLEENIALENNAVLVWYDENGNELNTSDLLENDVNYYVVHKESDYGCESEPLLISVSLSNCDPDEYDFFIPDGFSPNGDTINDTFYIPNIAFFYPNYDYEIFNRYGQSLFKGDANTPSWDGTSTSSQTETTSGVYFYILNYNFENLKPKQGRIYLSK